MRKCFTLLLVLTLAAALPAAAQMSDAGTHCGAQSGADGSNCCESAPATANCQTTDCAGAGAMLLVASSDPRFASRVSDSPESFLARLIAPPGRAPDTAPPKLVV